MASGATGMGIMGLLRTLSISDAGNRAALAAHAAIHTVSDGQFH